MALETATYLDSLVTSNPAGGDQASTADDHIRLLKACLLRTFPAVAGEISASHGAINAAAFGEVTAAHATSAVFATSATNATSAVFATSATNASSAVFANYAGSAAEAVFAVSATNASSAVFASSATNASSAVFATSASAATNAVQIPPGTKVAWPGEGKALDDTLSNVSGITGFSIDPSANYTIEGEINCDMHPAANLKVLFNVSQAPQFSWMHWLPSQTSGAALNAENFESLSETASFAFSTGGAVGVTLKGWLLGNASVTATLDLQWAQGTSSINTVTLKAGSWVRVQKVV